MKLKEIVGKQIAENCDSIAFSHRGFEVLEDFDRYEAKEDSLKYFLRARIQFYRMEGKILFAHELAVILKKIEEIDAIQDALEIELKHILRNIKNENFLSNGLWKSQEVEGNEKKKKHLEKVW